MKSLESIAKQIRNREGRGKPAPQDGIASVLYLLYTNFWKLVQANLLFILFSIPVVTMPAALTALNRVGVILIRERHVFVWDEFWKEFRRSIIKGFQAGLLFLMILFSSYYLLSLAISNEGSLYGVLCMVLGLVLLAAGLLWGSFTFIMLAMLDLPVRNILKNAFYVMMLGSRQTLYTALVIAVSLLVNLILFPWGIGLIIFCWAAVIQYIICSCVNKSVQKWIIAPYEKSREM